MCLLKWNNAKDFPDSSVFSLTDYQATTICAEHLKNGFSVWDVLTTSCPNTGCVMDFVPSTSQRDEDDVHLMQNLQKVPFVRLSRTVISALAPCI